MQNIADLCNYFYKYSNIINILNGFKEIYPSGKRYTYSMV